MKNLKGSLILLITAFIWGSAFVAQTTGAEYLEPFAFNALRSFVGSLFLIIVIMVKKILLNKNNKMHEKEINNIWPWLGGIVCGIVLFLAMGCQQWGITLYPEGVAASGRAGFITAIYVVLVAIVEQLRGKKIHWIIIISVLGTMVGMYLLCLAGGISNIYLGDVVVFLCAICFTGHILIVDKFKNVDSFKLSCIQFLTCAVISSCVSFVTENVDVLDIRHAWFSIFYAGVMSSGIAYTLQMVGQKYAEPAVASIVMSLESVFAVLTGWIVLHEILLAREYAGCVIVFICVILAQIPAFLNNKENKCKI